MRSSRALTGPAVCLAVCLALFTASCSSSKSSGGSASPTTAPTGDAYSHPGPFTVGVTTRTLPTGNAVEIWYPAKPGTPAGHDTYDVRAFLPPAIDKLLAAGVHADIETDATRNASIAPGKFPLVVFSHGFSGFRDQSSYLTTALASWGMVVAAPDHPSRDLASVLSAPAKHAPTDVDDLLATIDLIQKADTLPTGLLAGHVDLAHIATVGHSAGGAAVIKAAADPRVDGYVSLASANSLGRGGTTPPSTIPLPAKPSLFVAGANDRVVPNASTTKTYLAAPAPAYEWILAGSGHNVFDDLCTAGKGKGGLIGLADSAGIGKLVPAQLRVLATDGCEPPDADVTTVWPTIERVVTAFLRYLFGIDRQPAGLGPSGTRDVNGVSVKISARPG